MHDHTDNLLVWLLSQVKRIMRYVDTRISVAIPDELEKALRFKIVES
jgi:hypothetical protein